MLCARLIDYVDVCKARLFMPKKKCKVNFNTDLKYKRLGFGPGRDRSGKPTDGRGVSPGGEDL